MTTALSTNPSIPIDPRISAIASGIAAAIPEAQVRLFGSRAKGTSRPDSDVDLLITVPDQWLAAHDRVRVLGDLWRQYSSHGCRLTCFFTPKLKCLNASNTEVPLHPWLIKKEFC